MFDWILGYVNLDQKVAAYMYRNRKCSLVSVHKVRPGYRYLAGQGTEDLLFKSVQISELMYCIITPSVSKAKQDSKLD
jgi:hypothetical protein